MIHHEPASFFLKPMKPSFPLLLFLALWATTSAGVPVTFTGRIVDSATAEPIAARLYIRAESGQWFFPRSASPVGSAISYRRQHGGNTNAVEQHTTLSAHPFVVDLPEGRYSLTVERGKEYRIVQTNIVVTSAPGMAHVFALDRFVNMASMGWFSGDTHVHRTPDDLPNVQLAEDVNVVLPVVHWAPADSVAPKDGPRNFKGDFLSGPVSVDQTHVYYPLNSEYEIFTTGGTNHTSGAFMIAHHKQPFDVPVFPLKRVVALARSQGALIDLEKHNWPWSVVIVPIVKPDLFELANNHLWRAEFAVRKWAVPAPDYMGLEHGGLETEKGWALYGFQTYYALLNCGFRISPTAGTANGVHPVPLGFGRVYVHLAGEFSFDAWMQGLKAGRSFVTTGPMLIASIEGQLPGTRFELAGNSTRTIRVQVHMANSGPISKAEVVYNGKVISETEDPIAVSKGQARMIFERIRIDGPGWLAVRCWTETAMGRTQFAHSAPFYFDRKGESVAPSAEEAAFLIARAREEIDRSKALIPPEVLEEYHQSLKFYQSLKIRRAKRP